MLAEAEELSRQKDMSNIEFRIGDVHKLGFPDDQFDIVASRFAPHHFFSNDCSTHRSPQRKIQAAAVV